ncbi:hypothetical protein CNMCM5793_004844 [Aspergillus hiratsukae]|uniref:Uncharacterized protein n=1 Tax=Aspergillus hiratsukae TaxID=1194566 RepID=A0A8H6NZR5_9EURO|nr:hypothetical protein CNMCM5793_004844 [Aspergillus hiratsukae]KAF7155937.1 hypothetical protein CNMCM6106_007849 [Aspergillus hiratsukae]
MYKQPSRRIRAKYTSTILTIYQAYSSAIDAALDTQTLRVMISRTRMTWIEPSFLWMAYRSGWGRQPRQERVQAIQSTREGFE